MSLSVKMEKRLLFLERLTKVLYIVTNSLIMKYLFLITLFFTITNCSLNLVDDHHGVYFIEKKMKKIQVNSTNKNDIVQIFGEPSTKSTFDNDVWIYIERKITNTHLLGKRELIINNDYFNCKYCSFSVDDRSYRKPIIVSQNENVISPQTSFQILNILQGTVERGTAKSLSKIKYPLAGKTGTTNESKDLWFFGLTPRFVIGVYVGYDTPKPIGYKETGSSVALLFR